MTPDDPDPQDVPEFDRALGVDDLVLDPVYGDQRHHPERGAEDGGQIPVDDLHEALLEAEQTLRKIDEQLPEPLALNRSLTELRATTDAYARLDSEHRNGGD
ncbi:MULTISPECIES: hypothetical protein [Natrinema]|uniref:Uncharacterized protein n=1 Tax=Natrinema salsiterrestre TaxID=2950540 RepID=A0A9Q4L122_9EURY|nr:MULTISPECIES: hypothetical protein [Natrinema]MDF9748075.1 hypothetical protein [Natrinema salsiterrestre]MDS0478328.1 hypothetical protein [Natrinema sp. 1APR25-10V2]